MLFNKQLLCQINNIYTYLLLIFIKSPKYNYNNDIVCGISSFINLDKTICNIC